MGEEVGGLFGLWQTGFVLVSRGFSFCSVYRMNGKMGGYRTTSGRASFSHDSSPRYCITRYILGELSE